MSKFHVNTDGNPGKCTAQPGNCPFGDESQHHATPEAARAAFERDLAAAAVPAPASKPAGETGQPGPGAVVDAAALEAMPPASAVMFAGEQHRKGVDGSWYYGFGGGSRRAKDMGGAVVKENTAVPLLPTLETPELKSFMEEVDSLQESFPPHVREVRSLSEPVATIRTTGDSREYKFALDLLKRRIEDDEEFINSEAMDSRASFRWLTAVEGAERRLAQGW